MGWKVGYFSSKAYNSFTILVSIFLGRRLLSILTTVYVPSVLLNIIGHITCYFKPFYFESAVAVNLTVMLVLTSMFISVVAGLPVTSYIKMIEIWLLFTLMIPFIDVLMTCAIDNLRYHCYFTMKELMPVFLQYLMRGKTHYNL